MINKIRKLILKLLKVDELVKERDTYKNALLMIRYTVNEASPAWEIADTTLQEFEGRE